MITFTQLWVGRGSKNHCCQIGPIFFDVYALFPFRCCLELPQDSSSVNDGMLEGRSNSTSCILRYSRDVGKVDTQSILAERLSIRDRKVSKIITA